MTGKAVLVRAQAWADEMVFAAEAKMLHFEHRLIRGPAFIGHAVRGDHHSGAIVSQAAMHEYFFVGIVLEQLEESSENIVMGEWTMPWNRDILHSQTAHIFALAVAAISTRVYHDIDTHFGQRLETCFVRLPAPEKRGRDFSKVGDALDFKFLAATSRVRVLSVGRRLWRCLGSAFGDADKNNRQQH